MLDVKPVFFAHYYNHYLKSQHSSSVCIVLGLRHCRRQGLPVAVVKGYLNLAPAIPLVSRSATSSSEGTY